MMLVEDMFLKDIPTLDLHGLDRISAKLLINNFIFDNYNLRNKKVLIIHGKGKLILKEEVLKILSKNKYVLNYKVNIFNNGITIVNLKV